MLISAKLASQATDSLKIIATHAMILTAQYATNRKTTAQHVFQGTGPTVADVNLAYLTVPNVPIRLQLVSNVRKAIN
jgi:hypothetical protein